MTDKKFQSAIQIDTLRNVLRLCLVMKHLRKCILGSEFLSSNAETFTLSTNENMILLTSEYGMSLTMALTKRLKIHPVIYFGGLPTMNPGNRGFIGWLKCVKINGRIVPLSRLGIRSNEALHTINLAVPLSSQP